MKLWIYSINNHIDSVGGFVDNHFLSVSTQIATQPQCSYSQPETMYFLT